MDSAIFVNLSKKTIRAGITGDALPSASCKLLAQWQVAFSFFEPGSEAAALTSPTFRFALKETPTSSPLIYTSTLTNSGAVYTADFSSVDSTALRDLIADQPSIVVVGEIEWTVNARRERAHFPVTVTNAWTRPDDAAPDPIEEASVAWWNEQLTAYGVSTAADANTLAKRNASGALSAANFRATGTGFESVFKNNCIEVKDLTTQFTLTIQPPSEITEEIFLDLPNVSGTLLTHNSNLAANKLVGTVAPARLGTGVPSSSTYLRGDGVWSEAGGGVTSVNGTANQIVVTGTTTPTVALASTITGLTSVTSDTFIGALTGTASGNLVAGGALGTPSSGALTNCTSIPAAQLTGTINTARLPATITGLTSVTSTAFVGALTGTASGNLALSGGTLTGALTLPNAIVTGLSLTGSQATNTLDLSTVWNTTGNPALLYGRVTNTASGATADLINFGTVAGGALFRVDKNGVMNLGSNTQELIVINTVAYPKIRTNWGAGFVLSDSLGDYLHLGLGNTGVNMRSGYFLGWSSSATAAGTAADLLLYRAAAASLQLGTNHATTPTAQTIKAHNVTTGTGASLEIAGGTGSVARGAVRLNGGNRSAYIASPSATEIRDILISHGLMAAS